MYTCRVYKIINTEDDKIYVGSTRNKLSRRMAEHRRHCRKKTRLYVHKFMNEIGIDKFYIELLEEKEVPSKAQQFMLEAKWQKELNPELNRLRAHIAKYSRKIYVEEDQKEERKIYNKKYKLERIELTSEYNKQWHEKNKERRKEKKRLYAMEYRKKNPTADKEYFEKNKDKINARNRERKDIINARRRKLRAIKKKKTQEIKEKLIQEEELKKIAILSRIKVKSL